MTQIKTSYDIANELLLACAIAKDEICKGLANKQWVPADEIKKVIQELKNQLSIENIASDTERRLLRIIEGLR